MKKEYLQDLYSHYKSSLPLLQRIYAGLRLKSILIDEYLKFLSADDRILSLGCGYGFAEYYFALDSPSRYILGIDNDPRKINIARASSRHLKNIGYTPLDIREIEKIEPMGWNVVIANDLFHHLEYRVQDELVNKVSRLLKKKGIFIIRDVDSRPSLRKVYNTFHDRIFNRAPKVYYRDVEAYRNLAAKNSLQLDTTKYFHTYVFGHVFMVNVKI